MTKLTSDSQGKGPVAQGGGESADPPSVRRTPAYGTAPAKREPPSGDAEAIPPEDEKFLRFGEHRIPPDLRRELSAVKLRGFPEERLQDTQPPNNTTLTAPVPPPEVVPVAPSGEPFVSATPIVTRIAVPRRPAAAPAELTPVDQGAATPPDTPAAKSFPPPAGPTAPPSPQAAGAAVGTARSVLEDSIPPQHLERNAYEIKQTDTGSFLGIEPARWDPPAVEVRQGNVKRIAFGVIAIAAVLAVGAVLAKLVSEPEPTEGTQADASSAEPTPADAVPAELPTAAAQVAPSVSLPSELPRRPNAEGSSRVAAPPATTRPTMGHPHADVPKPSAAPPSATPAARSERPKSGSDFVPLVPPD